MCAFKASPSVFCTPPSSRNSSPVLSASSSLSSDNDVLSSSPHELFSAFYPTPLRCQYPLINPCTPSMSSPPFTFDSALTTICRRSQVLGAGGFGRVIVSSYNRRVVALKKVAHSGGRRQRLLSSELYAFLVPVSPYVVTALGFSVADDSAFHVMSELVDGGSLHGLLLDEEAPMDSTLRIHAIHQIARALSHCHSFGILHLDVKPSNVLFVRSSRSFKLADFGCSLIGEGRLVERKDASFVHIVCGKGRQTVGGTPAYQAPELFKGGEASCRSDVYGLALCAWQVMTGREPFRGLHPHQIVYAVVAREERPSVHDIDPSFCHLSSLLPAMWHSDPRERLSSHQIVDQIARIPS